MIFAEDIVNKTVGQHDRFEAWSVSISSLSVREKSFFTEKYPFAATAIVIGYHVIDKDEWTWFAAAKRELEHCIADDNTKEMCELIKSGLTESGYETEIVPYPGKSGLQFRFVAEAAGAGQIGKNAFLLHPLWGPWIHLQVLVTQAPSKSRAIAVTAVCISCGECISECPAGAIQENSFNGLLCYQYRKERGEYDFIGPNKERRYCTVCAYVCRIGQTSV